MNKNLISEFCRIFGATPRNVILDHFLSFRRTEYALSDLAKDYELSKATVYNAAKSLIREKYLIPTRRVGGTQLYKLNLDNQEVKLLIKIDNLILEKIYKEHRPKTKIVVKNQ